MSIQDTIEPYIRALEHDTSIIKWRLYASYAEQSTVGFSKKSVADIYQPASQQDGLSMQYAIELEGTKIAYGSINPTQTNPDDMITLAHKTAIVSPEALMLASHPKSSTLPKLIPDSGYPANLLATLLPEATRIRELLLEGGPKSIEGELQGTHRHTAYADSTGTSVQVEANRFEGSYELDGRFDVSFSTRSYDQLVPNLQKNITENLAFGKALREDIIKPAEKHLPIFLMGGGELIDKFLLNHLSGMSILTGSSRFTKEDFEAQLLVTHPSVSLSFDQTRDLHIDSFGIDSQGVMSQKYTTIQNGKLVEPICDLKSAHRLGYTARTGSNTGEAVLNNLKTFEDLSAATGTYLLAFSALGIHTQNGLLGTYSLPCAECLYFKDGKLVGPVKPVITGNFFDVLKSDTMQFVSTHREQEPMLFFETDVTFS